MIQPNCGAFYFAELMGNCLSLQWQSSFKKWFIPMPPVRLLMTNSIRIFFYPNFIRFRGDVHLRSRQWKSIETCHNSCQRTGRGEISFTVGVLQLKFTLICVNFSQLSMGQLLLTQLLLDETVMKSLRCCQVRFWLNDLSLVPLTAFNI